MTNACAAPTPFETLVALWSGELSPEAAEALEQHLFTCDACAAASERLGELLAGLREIVPPVLSHGHRDRLAAAGSRIRHTPVDAGVDADAHFTLDVDLLVHVLRGDLSRADRVDLEVLDDKGIAHFQFPNIPFDRQAGEVLVCCQRTAPRSRPPIRAAIPCSASRPSRVACAGRSAATSSATTGTDAARVIEFSARLTVLAWWPRDMMGPG